MKRKDKSPHQRRVPLFTTLAITDDTDQEPVTNISLPSELAVEEAKEWVEHNEL